MVASVTYSLETIESEFQANHWTYGAQMAPDVLGLSDGGYVVAYNNTDLSNGYIAMDFYDAAGNAVAVALPFDIDGDEIETSTDAIGAPSLTELDNGNVVVVWADTSDTGPGIRAAIFTSTGEPVGTEFAVADTGSEELPQVTALEGGGFVVCYQGGPVVLAKIFDDAGNATGPAYVILQTTAFASEPVITALPDGGFVAVWTSGDTADDTVIRARVFNADGTPRTVNGSTNDFIIGDGGDNSQPAVAALPNGGWAVAYTDTGWADQEGDVGITLTILGPDGNVVADAVQVNSSPSGSPPESDPAITVLDNGFIVVSWTYGYSPASGYDLYFRVFDQDGDPVTIGGSSGPRVLDVSGFTTGSAVSALFAGQFVGAWQDSQSDGSGGRISASVQELVRTTTGDGTSETLNGDDIRDIINGNGGNDTLNGFGGDDTLNGGDGTDALNGGAGVDTASYAGAAAGVTVSLDVGGAQSTGGAGNDTLSSIERLTGSSFADTLTGTSGDNVLSGGSGVDTLNGGGGNDRLDGGTAADNMAGGNGNDTYVVDGSGDAITEAPGFGNDTVESSVTHTLAANVDNLTLTGSAGTNGTGNGLANTIIGNSGANRIDGGGGTDAMAGGTGNDTYVVDAAGDTVTEAAGAGIDTVESAVTFTLAANVEKLTLTGTAGTNGTGNSLANTITGNAGVNRIDGGALGDSMAGGNGNDTYVVDSAGDVITELIGFGIDTVESSVTHTLAANVDKLTLTGTAGTNGTGNGLVNTIIGNSGANRIDGGIGADTMLGGLGNDTYIVDSGGDLVTETSGAGVDGVESSVTHTLAANVEKLTLTGSAGTNGTGNALANTIIGNNGSNRIDGDALNDTLTSGTGSDDFVFDDGDGADTVTDFQNGADQFDLTAVAGVNAIGDLTIIDNGATVTVNYGTGSFTIANLADPAQLDAGDFLF